jgi:hypothetical protein
MRAVHLFIIVLLAAWVTPAAGQSLAAVARKEEARRKQIKQSSRVITNKDLRQVDPGSAPTPAAAVPAPAATPAPADAAVAGDKPVDEEAQREQDEQAWRKKMADARLALERNQMRRGVAEQDQRALGRLHRTRRPGTARAARTRAQARSG